MSPDLLKAFFGAGTFVAGTSFFLLFIVERDSAEFVITVISLGIGIVLILLVALMVWYTNR
ncbi:MAG: hypothetical protein Q9P01_21525 [Anaerolineae bacterium]|nr:hypothetical protein [Anaerolineae bacterium]MDQ7037325.1 hypothetical protein [Anaerolineae bacterium]